MVKYNSTISYLFQVRYSGSNSLLPQLIWLIRFDTVLFLFNKRRQEIKPSLFLHISNCYNVFWHIGIIEWFIRHDKGNGFTSIRIVNDLVDMGWHCYFIRSDGIFIYPLTDWACKDEEFASADRPVSYFSL